MGIKMPETRANGLLQWARNWPLVLIGIGIVAAILWVTVLAWLIIKAVMLIV
jgi:hypothetical protein